MGPVDLHLLGAGLALDVAAPVVFTVTAMLHLHQLTRVATPTAHGPQYAEHYPERDVQILPGWRDLHGFANGPNMEPLRLI